MSNGKGYNTTPTNIEDDIVYDYEDQRSEFFSLGKDENDRRRKWIAFIFLVIALVASISFSVVYLQKTPEIYKLDNAEYILKSLMDIESVSRNEKRIGDFLEKLLKSNLWTIQKQQVGQNTFNIFAHRGNKNPRLILNSHMDTVPPYIGFSSDENYIYGRGASDSKGSITAQIFAIDQLLKEQKIDPLDIGLLYVVEEETSSRGMKKANELGLTPQFLIVGEPTEGFLALGHKGSIAIKLETKGKAAHSGYPELGNSSIVPMINIIQDLENHEWPYDEYFGQTTLNVGTIVGGVASNVVPESCNASISIRATISALSILEDFNRIVNGRATVEILNLSDPFRCSLVDGFETKMMSYGTDLPFFNGTHKSYLYGPGSILVAHTPEEKLAKEDLQKGIQDYKKLVLSLLN